MESVTITFTLNGDLTPLTLAEAIIDSYAVQSLWSTNDISELAGYLEVYVRHHLFQQDAK